MIPEEASAVRRTVQETLVLGPLGKAFLAARRLDPDFAAARGYRSVESMQEWREVEESLGASFLPEVRAMAQLAAPLLRQFPALLLPHVGQDGVSLVALRWRLLSPSPNGPKVLSLKGAKSTVSNASYLCSGGEVHICEGELDALTLEQYGLQAVGLPGAQQWKLLLVPPERLLAVSRLVLWFDADETGRRQDRELRSKLQELFGRSWMRERVRTVQIPARGMGKDVNDLHRQGTLAEFIGGAPWRA
jgi:hypothetical protein